VFERTAGVAARGPVAPPEAWRRYAEIALWPAWSPQLRDVEPSAAVLGTGVSGRVVAPLGVWARFVVLDVDAAARRWSWRVERGPVTMTLHHGLDALDDGGTRAWLRIRGPAPLAAGYVGPAWLALHRLVTLHDLPADGG
jgi:hypothetical protein